MQVPPGATGPSGRTSSGAAVAAAAWAGVIDPTWAIAAMTTSRRSFACCGWSYGS